METTEFLQELVKFLEALKEKLESYHGFRKECKDIERLLNEIRAAQHEEKDISAEEWIEFVEVIVHLLHQLGLLQ